MPSLAAREGKPMLSLAAREGKPMPSLLARESMGLLSLAAMEGMKLFYQETFYHFTFTVSEHSFGSFLIIVKI